MTIRDVSAPGSSLDGSSSGPDGYSRSSRRSRSRAATTAATGRDCAPTRTRASGPRSDTRPAHADAEHIDSGTGVDHADVDHADTGPEPTSPSTGSSTTRRGTTPAHTDNAPHEDVPVHWDTPHVDEHTDTGGVTDPEHLDTPYGDHTDSSSGFEVHDDSPHVDESFQDEPLVDHDDVHNDIPHGDTIV